MSTRLARLQNSAFGGPLSHQVTLLNTLRNQVQVLREENDRWKELGLIAEDRKNLEARLVEAQFERIKIANELLGATKNMQKFKEKADRAEATEGKIISLKNQLRDE